MTGNPAQVEPNFYRFSGEGVSVSYTTTSLDGQPRLTYHDSAGNKSFAGPQIKSEVTEIGTLVTVVLSRIADGDTTLFSVMLPSVRLSPGHNTPIHTFGVLTLELDTLIGPPLGQDENYTVKALSGLAAHVIF